MMRKNIAFFMMFAILTLGLAAQNLSNDSNDFHRTNVSSSVNNAVSVDCEHVTLPIVETFDDLADCWRYFSENPSNQNVLGPCQSDYGNVFRFSSMQPSGNYVQYLITPLLPDAGPIEISFDCRAIFQNETFQLGYSFTTDEPDDFFWSANVVVTTAGGTYSQALPAGTRYVAVKYTSNNQFYLYIDNLSITANSSTDCSNAVSEFPWTETFDNGVFPPTCWILEAENPDETWKVFNYSDGLWISCSGTQVERTEKLITRTLNFGNYAEIYLNFDFMSNYSYVDNEYIDLKVFASTDGGATFSSEPLWKLSEYGVFENFTSTPATVDLSSLAGANNVKLAFVYEGSIAQILFRNVKVDATGESAVDADWDSFTKVYPNPVQDVVYVNSESNINHIEIYALDGQKVKDISVNGSDVSISMSNLTSGLYMMKIYTPQGITVKKVDVVR